MDLDNRGIPYHKNSDGDVEMETRPMLIEEWLDTLPYADFNKTCDLLLLAVRDSNRISMKYTQRLELVNHYNHPYQYFIESQLRIRPNHTQRAIRSLQSNLNILKELSLAMGISCRISLDEALNRKTMWIQTKPPLEAILMSMTYFSHALVFCYLEYSPTPKTIWRELNFLYDLTESINKENVFVNEIGNDDPANKSSVAAVYKRIILTSLVDPYHLPFGACWEIYQAMNDWAELTEILEYREIEDTSGIIVMDLKNDVRPVPYSKFNKRLAKNRTLRMLYGGALVQSLRAKLKSLNSGTTTTVVPLAPHYAELVLQQLIEDLELPRKRQSKRQKKNLMVKIAQGFNGSHFFLNGEEEFNLEPNNSRNDVNSIVEVVTSDYSPSYSTEIWELQDFSAGGYSLRKELKSDNNIRVGELVGIYTGKEDNFNLGIVRWLMIRSGNMYYAGIEVIAKEVKPAGVKKLGMKGPYLRAFFSGNIQAGDALLVTEHGVCDADQKIEVFCKDEKYEIKTAELTKSTAILNQFSVKG